MTQQERDYHNSVRPTWGTDGTLVYQPEQHVGNANEVPEDGLIAYGGILSTRVGNEIRLLNVKDDVSDLRFHV